MKLKTRLAIAFVTFSVLPIMFVGLMLSVGRLFMVYRMDEFAPEVKTMVAQLMITAVLMLMFICGSLTIWVYRSILRPLSKLQEATRKIRDGNLDFTLDIEEDDEIGELCQDFEEMRIRLKESAEQKIQYDNENKELISNISHDLKTPITAIKGYVEGILDGVASSPEKLEKYIRTIYNKANDMDRLIDELTFYSKIDTNKIPYTFNKINVNSYFRDCAEEVGLDMESRGIELGYFNYVNEDVEVIADAEQMKRVINNIISNSVKYLDKPKGIINIRNQKWREDFSPIDPMGHCFADTLYSKAYLRHLAVSGEMLAAQIASLHNIAFYMWLVDEARRRIADGTFAEWKRGMVVKLTRRV